MTTFPRISTLTQQAADETADVYGLRAFPIPPTLLAEDDADEDDDDDDDEDDEDEDDDDEDDEDDDDEDGDEEDGDEEDEA